MSQEMSQGQLDQIMIMSVSIACKHLTDAELNSIYMSALLGINPKQIGGYDKVISLFTENDGTRMHPTAIDALAIVWESRCGKK